MEDLFKREEIEEMLRNKGVTPEMATMAVDLYCHWDGNNDGADKERFLRELTGGDFEKTVAAINVFSMIVSMVHNERIFLTVKSHNANRGGAYV